MHVLHGSGWHAWRAPAGTGMSLGLSCHGGAGGIGRVHTAAGWPLLAPASACAHQHVRLHVPPLDHRGRVAPLLMQLARHQGCHPVSIERQVEQMVSSALPVASTGGVGSHETSRWLGIAPHSRPTGTHAGLGPGGHSRSASTHRVSPPGAPRCPRRKTTGQGVGLAKAMGGESRESRLVDDAAIPLSSSVISGAWDIPCSLSRIACHQETPCACCSWKMIHCWVKVSVMP